MTLRIVPACLFVLSVVATFRKIAAMIYREFEIESFEIGRGQWHARFRRRDRAPTVIDGVEFEFLNIGFAWPSQDAAVADAQDFIDRMRSRS